jgi:hypothetical protein
MATRETVQPFEETSMKRITALVALCAVVSLPALGCTKKDKGTENPDSAESDADPLTELQAIPDQIQAEVDMVLQPINDVDVVVEQVTSIPTEHGVDAASLTGLAKASFEGGTVSVDLDVSAEAKAEIETMLKTIQGIAVGLKETPERATAATKNILALGVKATGLVGKLQAKYQAKLSNPLAKAEEKAKIQGELDLVLKIDGEIKTTIGEAKSTVTGVPAKGTEAMGKLTAALAGGGSAGATDDASGAAEPAGG